MKKIFSFFILLAYVALPLFSQTKEEAHKLFLADKFAEAKPVFLKYLKKTPKDASLNYWYAVCCIHTGDTIDVSRYLKLAADRKVPGARRYLGDYYYDRHLYEAAATTYEAYLGESKLSDSLKTIYTQKVEQTKKLARMVKSTTQICFIDSFVVDKEDFLKSYHISSESGRIDTYNHYFGQSSRAQSTVYESGLGDLRIAARPTDEGIKLTTAQKVSGEWSNPQPLPGLEMQGNQNYPFLESDGTTLYFASDGSESLGGYDIFVTRYGSEQERYLLPENVGMPFNSTANDYMMVIDEVNDLGWFATDRRQPQGKVCIYVFIPPTTRVDYDYENSDPAVVGRAADIASIAATQTNAEEVRQARQRLMMAIYQPDNVQVKHDFDFVIDDLTDYYTLNDFKSAEAKKMYATYLKDLQQFKKDSVDLEARRMQYHNATAAQKESLAPAILEREKQLEFTEASLQAVEEQVRNTEKQYLSR